MKKEPVTLEYPIEVDGIETDTLHLRRVTIGDLEDFEHEKSERKQLIKLLARLSGVSEKTIKTMDVVDFETATNRVMDFLGVNSRESENS